MNFLEFGLPPSSALTRFKSEEKMPIDINENSPATLTIGKWVLLVLLSFVSLITVIGNLVVISVLIFRTIRHMPMRCLIISLAVADLMVGAFVMPLNIAFESNGAWIWGRPLCDIWRAVDVLACTASIWNLCVMSFDKYLALKNPFRYSKISSTRRIGVAIGMVWVFSALISFPAIEWWHRSENAHNTSANTSLDKNDTCEFIDDLSYVAFASLVSFYVPLFLMLFACWRIYLIALKVNETFRSGCKYIKQIQPPSPTASKAHRDRERYGSNVLRIHKGNTSYAIDFPLACKELPKMREAISLASRTHCGGKAALLGVIPVAILLDASNRRNNILRPAAHRSGSLGSMSSASCSCSPTFSRKLLVSKDSYLKHDSRHKRRLTRKANSSSNVRRLFERKSAKTLGVVMGCFVICWLPFFVVNLVFSIWNSNNSDKSENGDVDEYSSTINMIFNCVTWLGYCNSMLNPFIYAFCNRRIRKALTDTFCRCAKAGSSYAAGASTSHRRHSQTPLPAIRLPSRSLSRDASSFNNANALYSL